MKRTLVTLVALAIPALSQTTIKDALVKHWKASAGLTLAVAEAMPAADYNFKPNPEEMSFGQHISSDLWARLEETYVGAGLEENWDALFRTICLFRDVSVEVGKRLGYVYPDELDRRCVQHFENVKRLDREAKDVVAAFEA